jgi:hypothetical protein
MDAGSAKRPAGGRITLIAPPDIYTAKLTVSGKDYVQKLTVLTIRIRW